MTPELLSPPSKSRLWSGWILSILPSLLLILSGAMKLLNTPQVREGFTHLGLPVRLSTPLGVLELTCALIYLIPRTAVLGAILVTGYLGGAIVSHLRLGEPFIVQTLLGAAVWGGIYLRDPRLAQLLPFRR